MCAAILISIIARSHLLHTHKCQRTRKDKHRYKQTHVCDKQGETDRCHRQVSKYQYQDLRQENTFLVNTFENTKYQYQDFVGQPPDLTCLIASQEQSHFFFSAKKKMPPRGFCEGR